MLNRLAVIGFDAQLDGLENVDQVVAAFYRGSTAKNRRKPVVSDLYRAQDLVELSRQRVIEQVPVSVQQPQLILVSNQPYSWEQDHQWVCCFGEALSLAELLIADNNTAVLIICVQMMQSESDWLKPENSDAQLDQANTISFDRDFTLYQQTQGIASVLLSSEDFARAQQTYVYSYINAMSVTDDLSQPSLSDAIRASFAIAKLQPQQISSIEVSALACDELQLAEQTAILNGYRHQQGLHTSLSCIKSVIGESNALSPLCGFLNCVFSLQLRYRSAIQGWESPQSSMLPDWVNSPFYVLNDAVTDFSASKSAPRKLAYSCLSDSHYAHIIFEENGDGENHDNGLLACSDSSLFIVSGDTQAQLINQLNELVAISALPDLNLKKLAKQLYSQRITSQQTYSLVLIAASHEQLSLELKRALTGILNTFATQQDWKTPQGSYFCVNRQIDPKTCFLYPGIGATYLGLGRELLQLFPDVYPAVEKLIQDSHAGIKDQLLNPRSISKLSFDEVKARDLVLRRNLADIAECGVGYAYIFTRVFKDVLNINADFSAGYSMGEVSMFAALDCWQSPGKMSERLADSPTFNQQLSGELKVLENCWHLPKSSTPRLPQQYWESYNIKGNVEQVQGAIKADERVYITLINTPDSLVIAGFPDDCLAVAKRLGVRALALNVHNAIHSEPAYQEYDRMVDLYSMDIAGPVSTKLYSSSCYLPIPFNQKAIAVSIAKCLCEPVDFPRLIKTIKAAGASVFIEMGAGRSLCTWTDKILSDENKTLGNNAHTVAINAKGTDLQQMIMRAVAKLVSLGVDVNLKPFFEGSIIVNDNTVSRKTHSKPNM